MESAFSIIAAVATTGLTTFVDPYIGCDDNGHCFAAATYPFDPCGGDYVLGAPQLPRVRFSFPGGKVFTVIALSKENKYVKSATLNGRPLDGFILRHADILAGGTLEFEMTKGK